MNTCLPLQHPTNLQAGSGGSGTVDLSWEDNSDNETGFRIQRKDSTNIFSEVGTVNANETTFTDNVSDITTYTYRVIAYNDSAVSNYSNEAEIMITQIPVNLISFSGQVSGSKVMLSWMTATETNNKGFAVERSFGDNWAEMSFINGHGTTSERSTYNYTDDFTNNAYQGIVEYRLKQVDFDGTYSYSRTVMINLNIKSQGYYLAQNYPNPFNPSTKIRFNIPEESRVKLSIINNLGEVIEQLADGETPQGTYEKVWNASKFASGIYYVSLSAESEVSDQTYLKVLKILYLK